MPPIAHHFDCHRLIGSFLIVFSFLIGGCQLLPGSLANYAPTPTFPPFPQPTTAPLATAVLSPTPAAPGMIVSRQVVEDGKNQYRLELNYPYLEGAIDPRFQLFNQEISRLVENIRQGFKQDNQSVSVNPDPSFSPSLMTSDYSIENGTQGLLSVRFTVGFYMSGAAHPNQFAATLNLDIANGKVLALRDLFKTGIDYLTPISDYCIQDLNKQARIEWDSGAAPNEENFQKWNITPQGLLISFDPYQVASYAMGPQAVTIPYAAIKDLLNPSGPLGPFIH
jgi:peptidoglycan-N-acetylglucosamine deacetylase